MSKGENERNWAKMSENDRQNQVSKLTSRAVCEHEFPYRARRRHGGGNPRFTPKIAIPTLRMRPNLRSWLRYNRETR